MTTKRMKSRGSPALVVLAVATASCGLATLFAAHYLAWGASAYLFGALLSMSSTGLAIARLSGDHSAERA